MLHYISDMIVLMQTVRQPNERGLTRTRRMHICQKYYYYVNNHISKTDVPASCLACRGHAAPALANEVLPDSKWLDRPYVMKKIKHALFYLSQGQGALSLKKVVTSLLT